MAGIWGPIRHWREDGNRHQPHPHVVHVYIFSYAWFTHNHIHDPCILDEY
jgi:hypothetical protein